jgi:hypothetical protein
LLVTKKARKLVNGDLTITRADLLLKSDTRKERWFMPLNPDIIKS